MHTLATCICVEELPSGLFREWAVARSSARPTLSLSKDLEGVINNKVFDSMFDSTSYSLSPCVCPCVCVDVLYAC